jgi:sugar lactone lactonase YvrE
VTPSENEDTVAKLHTLMTGIVLGESPRWHEDRLWFSDWGSRELITLDLHGRSDVVLRMPSLPFCTDWLPDGRLLITSGGEALLLRREHDGSLVTHADLSRISKHAWNEVVVDAKGNAYVNTIDFDFPGGKFKPGMIALVSPDGSVRQAADGIAFPNGMAVTPDNSTLIVAESFGRKLTAFDITLDGSLAHRRVWADLGDDNPDGICLDSTGAVWYGSQKRCVRVCEGGKVLDAIDLPLPCFSCALGGPDGKTLFMVAAEWRGEVGGADSERTGKVLTTTAPEPAAARPSLHQAGTGGRV